MATVLLFGAFQDLAGWDERRIDAPTLGALKAAVAEGTPELAARLDRQATLVILNQALMPRSTARDDHPIAASDEVAFGPPVSGG
jgi:sulfur-carrier protein